MRIRQLILLLLLCPACNLWCNAQDKTDSASPAAVKVTQNYINAIDSKATAITEQMDKQTEKYIALFYF